VLLLMHTSWVCLALKLRQQPVAVPLVLLLLPAAAGMQAK